jgi:D-hexose-6-phosphate mutarotase
MERTKSVTIAAKGTTPAIDQSLASLNEHYGRKGRLVFGATSEGLIWAEITNELCQGRVYLQGGHVTHYQPAGKPAYLWTSSASLYQPGKAIRGGIPVCWPWFGNHPSESGKPAHGFARTSLWSLVATDLTTTAETSITLIFNDSPETHCLWPHPFHLTLTIVFGASLRLFLTMRNSGSSPVSISCALHSYFRIADWRTCRIHGLDCIDYLDKVDGYGRKQQSGAISLGQETDRIYLLPDSICRIESPETGRDILVRSQGSSATVVWNPGPIKAAAMADMIGEEYREMVCVEAAIAPQEPLVLRPGESHVLATEIG